MRLPAALILACKRSEVENSEDQIVRGTGQIHYMDDACKLVLARDPFGIKPLYYVETRDCFAFASEPEALIRAGLTQQAGGGGAYGGERSTQFVGHRIEQGAAQALPLTRRFYPAEAIKSGGPFQRNGEQAADRVIQSGGVARLCHGNRSAGAHAQDQGNDAHSIATWPGAVGQPRGSTQLIERDQGAARIGRVGGIVLREINHDRIEGEDGGHDARRVTGHIVQVLFHQELMTELVAALHLATARLAQDGLPPFAL